MSTTADQPDASTRRPCRGRRSGSLEVFCVVLAAAVALRGPLVSALDSPVLRTASTVFVAVCVQALPFLVLGTLLSGLLAAVVTPAALRRLVPARAALAVPIGSAAGVALPGCECASVPVARRLIGQGAPEGAALAFLLSSPAINPVVLVATAVAFPGHPEMVGARLLGSAGTALAVGWAWPRLGGRLGVAARLRAAPPIASGRARWTVFAETARHDLVGAGGFLVLGGVAAAVMTVLVPRGWLAGLAGHVLVAVAVMAVLAVVLALCSEADAFVAASLSAVPLLPRLVFLVVGPAVDLKLVALHVGTFGRAFAARFVPLAFVAAVVCGVVAGVVVLGATGWAGSGWAGAGWAGAGVSSGWGGTG